MPQLWGSWGRACSRPSGVPRPEPKTERRLALERSRRTQTARSSSAEISFRCERRRFAKEEERGSPWDPACSAGVQPCSPRGFAAPACGARGAGGRWAAGRTDRSGRRQAVGAERRSREKRSASATVRSGPSPGRGPREESKAGCWGSGRARAVDCEAEPSLAGKDSAGRGEKEEKTKARL